MSTGSKLLTVGAFYPYTVRNLARPAFHAIRSLPRPTSRPGFTSSSRLSVPETGASASSGTRGPGEKSGTKGLVRISHLFGALAGVGLLVTIYGLLEYYYSLQTWPEPVRTPLKAALKAKHRGEVDRAEPYFRQRVSFSLQTSRVRAEVLRAIDAALSIPPSTLDPIPLLKVTGIYIALAAMLERDGRLLEAYKDLYLALALYGEKPLDLAIGQSPGGWAGEYKINDVDHLRIIGLEQKLGQLALEVPSGRSTPAYPLDIAHNAPSNWDDAAERHLSGAVKAMLQLGLSHRSAQAGKQGGTNEPVVVGRDIDLPAADEDGEAGRVDRRGLGMTMEHLAEVYARKGQYDLAGQLLLQAVSAILPPDSSQRPSLGDRCQAAMLMTTISSHALHPRTPQAIKTSRSWSNKALEISEEALSANPSDPACRPCAQAQSVGLYNLGMLAEIEGDYSSAIKYFHKALATARLASFIEGRREAAEAIRRVQNSSGGMLAVRGSAGR